VRITQDVADVGREVAHQGRRFVSICTR
jgi:hypothetical protein